MALYLKHFCLKREPFSIVPDPGFLYPSIQHRQAIAHLKYGLDREGGFILLTGEVGTGKTTLTRTLLKSLPAHIRVAYVLNSKLEVGDLLASICHELAIDLPATRGLSFAKECTDALYHDLLAVHAEGKKTLVVIEEGQNLSADVLETLRLLSNLETHTDKLLHILLVGQPELLEALAQRELRQLNQRVVARFHLLPLERDELVNYINYRLHRAGAQKAIFDADCIAALFRLTKGVPRLINLVCQHSLLAAYSVGSQTVSGKLLKRAASEILAPSSESLKATWRRRLLLPVLMLSVGLGLGFGMARGPLDLVAGIDALLALIVVAPYEQSQTGELGVQPKAVLGDTQSVHQTVHSGDLPLAVAQSVESSVRLLTNTVRADSEVEIPQQKSSRPSIAAHGGLPELVTILSPVVPSFDAETALLKLWLSPNSRPSRRSFAAILDASGLRLINLRNIDLDLLLEINRPGIVELQRSAGRETLVVRQVTETSIRLQGAEGIENISREDFVAVWSGSYRHLWKPPMSYGVLQDGLANRQLIDWLQARLARLDDGYERVITGGRYSAAIRSNVLAFQQRYQLRTDGILGRETTMMINALTDSSIPLLRSEGS